MRKGLLSIVCASLSMAVAAQSLAIDLSSSDTLSVGNAYTSGDIESHVTVENISSNPVDVLVKRIDKNYNALTDSNAICWQICFLPSVSVSPPSTIITLQPGEKSEYGDFSGHVYPDKDGVPHSGEITYVFFDANNPSDTAAHTVKYEVNTTFDVKEMDADQLLEVYPNPATNQITVSYDLQSGQQGHFELVNVVGNKVFSRALKSQTGELKLDIGKLPRGVYFYILRSEGESMLTRKLVME